MSVDPCDRLLLDRSNAHSLDSSPSIDRHLPAPAGGLVEPGSDDPPFSKRAARVVRAFRIACQAGNRVGLAATLAPDVTVVTDSGGKVRIARHAVRGVDHVSRFLVTLLARQRAIGVSEHALTAKRDSYFGETNRWPPSSALTSTATGCATCGSCSIPTNFVAGTGHDRQGTTRRIHKHAPTRGPNRPATSIRRLPSSRACVPDSSASPTACSAVPPTLRTSSRRPGCAGRPAIAPP